KVCNVYAGSALLQDEALVAKILHAVVRAVDVPVTLKIRTGWDPQHRNGVSIARIAEDHGVQALAVHGRTRACMFRGEVEYDTIAQIKQSIAIPVIANGDINSPHKARFVLDYTGADAVMLGRAARGRPWIFQETAHFLQYGKIPAPMPDNKIRDILLQHVNALHSFYGEFKGVLIARKHVAWYLRNFTGANDFGQLFNRLTSASRQLDAIGTYLEHQRKDEELAA
ncbi:MAG: tRNA-dihydrouridine synthase, partial [Pseudohongiellaceae bacterium]